MNNVRNCLDVSRSNPINTVFLYAMTVYQMTNIVICDLMLRAVSYPDPLFCKTFSQIRLNCE